MRLTTSPSQKTGIEMPISPRIMSKGSTNVPRMTAAARPMAMATTTQMIAAPKTSENVTGAASTICGITLAPRLTNDVRSRVMNSFFIMITYWTGSGRSRPKSWRTCFSVSGSALRPAMRAAGSTPGVAKKIRNTSTLSANMTNSVATTRRMMNAITGGPP